MRRLILNVDDFEPQRHARTRILQAAGFEVIEAATGGQALALATEHHPALVLLDVQLPDADGREICRQIKGTPATADILVLHISAIFRDAPSRAAALSNGADGYLVEAVEPDELVAQVNALLRLAAAESRARRSQLAAEEGEARYHRLFEHMTEGFLLAKMIWDEAGRPVDYRYLDVNPAFERFTGITREAAVGHTRQEVVPGVEPTWVDTFARVVASGTPATIEALAAPLGRYYSAVAYRAAPGQFACLFRDITESHEAEQRLRESEEAARRRAEELEALMELVPAAIWVADDPECRVITGNRTANLFYEASPGDNVSAGPAGGGERDIARRFFRDGVELAPEKLPMQQAVATGCDARDLEVEVLLPSGRHITILGSATPLFDEGGGVRGAIAAFVDISDRKRMEAAMQQARDLAEVQRAEIASLYDSAPIGLCTFDPDGRYLRVNRRLAEMNGVAPELHVGRTVREVVPSIADQAELLLEHVRRTGEPLMGIEIVGETASEAGIRRAWSENWLPVKGPAGDVLAINVGVEEITRSKQIEEELREANRLKDDFLATLSHELRTPLTAILGWSQLLLQPGDMTPQMLRQGLTTIARNAETQRTMVNDVLDVSRIISGKMRLQLEELDLLAVVADAVESMKPALEAKRLYLDLSALAAPATVTGDPDRLRQVIWNLLSNAVKFTPDGGRITLSVVRGEHTLDLQVSDNGLGIRPEFLPYVFDRFSQADRTASRRHAGLGLGLAIVRHLVELHGGQVFVASDGEGKGSTFTVSLPIRAVRQIPTASAEKGDASQGGVRTAVPALSATVLRGVRVLVLDDLEDARAVVAAVLQAAGAHTVVVRSGEEALEALAARPADVVLADIGMPGMDGFEFLRRLRATGNGVPVIALTAYGGAADRTRILAAGFDQHLTKPVLPGELLAGLAKTLEQERAAPR